jgi:LacI family transcriptional regulator
VVTMRDVAARAGVTKQTVSNVLNNPAIVAPATVAKVNAAIAELGYIRNLTARGLATGKSMIIGFIVPTVSNPFYSEVVEEVEVCLESRGYNLLLCTTRTDSARAARHLATLAGRSIDGLLVAGDSHMGGQLPLLDNAAFPYVLCAWETEAPADVPMVTIDYEWAGYLAGAHLRDLGHRNVAVVADLPAHDARVRGFRKAMAESGVQVSDDFVYDAAGGVAAGQAARQAISDHPELTAIMASHDVLALGILEETRMLGLSVPAELSLIGIDDVMADRHSHPPLTSVALPKRAMARRAVEMVLSGGTDRHASTVLLVPELVVRASTGDPGPVKSLAVR